MGELVFSQVFADGASNEGDEGKGRRVNQQDRTRGRIGEQKCREEIRLQEGLGEPCGGGREGGEEGQVHHPWSGDGEDPLEAGNQGWQERDLRQACDGEGKASEDDRKGLPHGCSEEGGVSQWRCAWTSHAKQPP